jgi:flagellar protein FlaG
MNIQSLGPAVLQTGASPDQRSVRVEPAASAAAPAPAAVSESPAELSKAVASINQTLQKLAPGLEFSIDQESNRTIVKVVDQQTKELIRQMPSAETLEIAKALDRVQGLLISLRA